MLVQMFYKVCTKQIQDSRIEAPNPPVRWKQLKGQKMKNCEEKFEEFIFEFLRENVRKQIKKISGQVGYICQKQNISLRMEDWQENIFDKTEAFEVWDELAILTIFNNLQNPKFRDFLNWFKQKYQIDLMEYTC